jgi:hypothetical protein
MPWFVDKAVRIIVGIRHNKSKISCISSEPIKRGGIFEAVHQVRVSRGSYIESQTGVMLAEAGRGIYRENRVQVHALPEFSLDDLALTIDASKAGNKQQFNTVAGSRALHRVPLERSLGAEVVLPLVSLDRNQVRRLKVGSELPKCTVVGWYVKRPMDRLDTAKVSFRNFGNHFLIYPNFLERLKEASSSRV